MRIMVAIVGAIVGEGGDDIINSLSLLPLLPLPFTTPPFFSPLFALTLASLFLLHF
jgi:hypothetical protein